MSFKSNTVFIKSKSFIKSDPVTPARARPSEQHIHAAKKSSDVSGHGVPKLVLAQTANSDSKLPH